MNDHDCIRLLQAVLPRLGMRWAGFRKPRRQVCRRITRRMGALGLRSVDAYLAHLERHPDEWRLLDRLCRVTISRFRRDRRLWERLETEVLPERAACLAAAGGGTLLCWSAGCASGEEPYTLALVWLLRLAGRFPGVELSVLATDADLHMLWRARRGVYPAGALRELPEEWVEAAFEPVPGSPVPPDRPGRPGRPGREPDPELRLVDRFRRPVRLVCADVRDPPPEARFDLVLCRNLAFVYFREDVQRRLLGGADRGAGFARCVRPGGYLAVGAHEALPSGVEAWEDEGNGLHRRRAGGGPGADDSASSADPEDSRP